MSRHDAQPRARMRVLCGPIFFIGILAACPAVAGEPPGEEIRKLQREPQVRTVDTGVHDIEQVSAQLIQDIMEHRELLESFEMFENLDLFEEEYLFSPHNF